MAEPKFSVCELTTLHLSFDEELELLETLGVPGIGLFEQKLPEGQDGDSIRKLREAGLTATVEHSEHFRPGRPEPTHRMATP